MRPDIEARNRAEREVQSRGLEGSFSGVDPGVGLFDVGLVLVHLELADRPHVETAFVLIVVRDGEELLGLVELELPLRLEEGCFIGARIDLEEHVALAERIPEQFHRTPHFAAFRERHPLEFAGNSRANRDRLDRVGAPGVLGEVCDLVLDRVADRDGWRRTGRRWGSFLLAPEECAASAPSRRSAAKRKRER